mmetsp:Transcript_8848/g.12597  ORF Transcript_8848/g.12597 Transcript_8848/m.12597 type:complete len:454 (-) Transcript_8848:140-1501(-)
MSSLLRRRGNLVPIHKLAALDLEEKEDSSDDPFVVFYSSPCQIRVSNDPEAEPKPITKPNPCNITFYDCSATDDTGSINVFAEQAMSIEYDYELHYTKGANLEQTLFGLEASMLEHLASATGLVDCPVLQNNRRLQESRGKRLMENHDLPDLFSAVSSDRVDTADDGIDECIGLPVPKALSETTECQPMKGYMTAYIRGDVELSDSVKSSVQNSIQRFVRAGMNSNIYTTGNIRKVSYIGTVVDHTAGGATIGQENNGGKSGLRVEVMVAISLGAVIIILFAGIVLLKRKRSQYDFVEEEELQQSQQGSNHLASTPGSVSDLKPQQINHSLSAGNDSDGTNSDSDSEEGKNSPPRSPPRARNNIPADAVEQAPIFPLNMNIMETPGKMQRKRRKKRKSPKPDGSPSLECIPESDEESEDGDDDEGENSIESLESIPNSFEKENDTSGKPGQPP